MGASKVGCSFGFVSAYNAKGGIGYQSIYTGTEHLGERAFFYARLHVTQLGLLQSIDCSLEKVALLQEFSIHQGGSIFLRFRRKVQNY